MRLQQLICTNQQNKFFIWTTIDKTVSIIFRAFKLPKDYNTISVLRINQDTGFYLPILLITFFILVKFLTVGKPGIQIGQKT